MGHTSTHTLMLGRSIKSQTSWWATALAAEEISVKFSNCKGSSFCSCSLSQWCLCRYFITTQGVNPPATPFNKPSKGLEPSITSQSMNQLPSIRPSAPGKPSTNTRITLKPAGKNTQFTPLLCSRVWKIQSLNLKKPTNKTALIRVSAVFCKVLWIKGLMQANLGVPLAWTAPDD